MHKNASLLVVLLLFAQHASADVSSPQAYSKGRQYAKGEAPVIYERPMVYLNTEFWVVKLSGESPRYIAINVEDDTISPITSSDVLGKLVETYIVTEELASLMSESSFLLGPYGESVLTTQYSSQYQSLNEGLKTAQNSVTDPELLAKLNQFTNKIEKVVVPAIQEQITDIDNTYEEMDDFKKNPRYSELNSLKTQIQTTAVDTQSTLNDLSDFASEAATLKGEFQAAGNPEYATVIQILGSTPPASQIQTLKFNINTTYNNIRRDIFDTAKVIAPTYAAASIDRIHEVDAENAKKKIEATMTYLLNNLEYFRARYPVLVPEIELLWQAAQTDLAQGKYEDAISKFTQTEDKLAEINLVIKPGQEDEPTQPQEDYSGVVGLLTQLVIVLIVGIVLYSQREKIKGFLSKGGEDEEDYSNY